MAETNGLGRGEGQRTGPLPGEGATRDGAPHAPDVEGTPPDALPDLRGHAAAPGNDAAASGRPRVGWWLLNLGVAAAILLLLWLVATFAT